MSVSTRKLIADRYGTDVDNVEEDNGSYYVLTRGLNGVVTHKHRVMGVVVAWDETEG